MTKRKNEDVREVEAKELSDEQMDDVAGGNRPFEPNRIATIDDEPEKYRRDSYKPW